MSEPVQEFPKLLWSAEGREVTVQSFDEQQAKLAEGYRLTFEPAPIAEPEPVVEVPPADPENEPATFGAPDDDSFGEDDQVEDGKAKKGGKKK